MKCMLGAVLVAFSLTVAPLGAQQSASPGQTTFCGDDAPDDLRLKAGVLPKEVLTAVLKTKQAREARSYAKNNGESTDFPKLLRATRVKLASSSDDFFLVIGEFPISGADNTWFWIVRKSGPNASVLLWEGANCIEIEQTRTLGFRDISSHWSSAGTTSAAKFVYDGNRYRLKKRNSLMREY